MLIKKYAVTVVSTIVRNYEFKAKSKEEAIKTALMYFIEVNGEPFVNNLDMNEVNIKIDSIENCSNEEGKD